MSRRHVPPSRRRYEKKHPVVSFRVPVEDLQRLKELQAKTGKSRQQLLKAGLGLLELKLDEAYRRGYRDGWGRFTVPCKFCKEPMEFDIKSKADAKQVVLEAFSEWYHVKCLKKRRER